MDLKKEVENLGDTIVEDIAPAADPSMRGGLHDIVNTAIDKVVPTSGPILHAIGDHNKSDSE